MSDFHQHGLICTLQRLTDKNTEAIEAEIVRLAVEKPVSLVLPCHYSELGQPALAHIVGELSNAEFLCEIIVSMNGMDESGFRAAKKYFSAFPQPHRILWNDGPGLGRVYRLLADVTHTASEPGKGFNIWAAAGLVVAEGKSEIIATQDCDVASFRREMLARLCFACLQPDLGYDCAKMYYSRVTDRIYGRVSRLFLTPLLHALVRVVGHHPLLDFLLSFRYPLSGECALRRDLAATVSLRADWGLEIGLLCEVFRAAEPNRVCQVDGGGNYDHKHQPLEGDSGGGLYKMSRQIARALLDHLAAEGVSSNDGFLPVVEASYRRESREALLRYKNLALINDLPFDATAEQQAVESFARALTQAAGERGLPQPVLPSWKRIASLLPDFPAQFLAAVAEENN